MHADGVDLRTPPLSSAPFAEVVGRTLLGCSVAAPEADEPTMRVVRKSSQCKFWQMAPLFGQSSPARQGGRQALVLGKPPSCRVLFLTVFYHYRLPHVMYYLALNEPDEGEEEMRDCEKQRGKVDE